MAGLFDDQEAARNAGLEPETGDAHVFPQDQAHASVKSDRRHRIARRSRRKVGEHDVARRYDGLVIARAELDVRPRDANLAAGLDPLTCPHHRELVGGRDDALAGQVHHQHVLPRELEARQGAAGLERCGAADLEHAVAGAQRACDAQHSLRVRPGVELDVLDGDAQRNDERAGVDEPRRAPHRGLSHGPRDVEIGVEAAARPSEDVRDEDQRIERAHVRDQLAAQRLLGRRHAERAPARELDEALDSADVDHFDIGVSAHAAPARDHAHHGVAVRAATRGRRRWPPR